MKRILLSLLLCAALLAIPAVADQTAGQTIAPNEEITDHLEDAQDVNTYHLTLEEPGAFCLQLQFVPGGDYLVELLAPNDQGALKRIQLWDFYYNAETVDGTIVRRGDKLRLPAGEYTVRVKPYSSNYYRADPYVFTPVWTPEPGEEFEKEWNDAARNAMPAACNLAITGNLCSSDDVDYYRVTLPEPGSLRLQLEFIPGADYIVEISRVNMDGGLVQLQRTNLYFDGASETGIIQRRADKLRLPAGIYYVLIKAYSSNHYRNSDYVMTLNYTAETEMSFEKEFNNSGRNAMPIFPDQPVTGNLADSEDSDFYRFTLDEAGTVQLKFEFRPKGDYMVYLYRVSADGGLVEIQKTNFYSSTEAAAETLARTAESISLGAGNYYVQVKAYSSNGYYNGDYILTVLGG